MRKRVAIVYNEPSPSRYDSHGEGSAIFSVLQAVDAVQHALLDMGYCITRVPITSYEHIQAKLTNLETDVVFNLFEGICGHPETEALVPDILSKLGIPYTGCPGKALRMALDKAMMKRILKSAGIRTPDFQLLNPDTINTFRLSYPCIVKPRCEDASHGLSPESVVSDHTALKKQVSVLSKSYKDNVMVEEFLGGREFNATVLGNSVCTILPISEIVYSLPPGVPELLTFAAKWDPESIYFHNTNAVCPANINPDEQEYITKTVLEAFWLLRCQGYARVDMRMDDNGFLNIIEVNPNPDISPDAGTVRQAKASGMTYKRLIDKVVQLGLSRRY